MMRAAPAVALALAAGLASCVGAPARPRVAAPTAAPRSQAPDPALAAERRAADAATSSMRLWASSHGDYFRRTWGVDVTGVRLLADGWMLEFKFRVVDPLKAGPILDVNAKPYLVDDRSGAVLSVPAMENVGELRQHTAPRVGRSYFMIFGNANKIVARGSDVSVMVGRFAAQALPVL